jgi:transcriptional regulator with XRE-family HTH domain
MSASRRSVFGANVRRRRREKGLTQETLSFSCNLHRTYIGAIERGEQNIGIDNMERIAAALSVDLPKLLGDATASKMVHGTTENLRQNATS